MAKLDRLGWADGMSFTSHGVRLGLRVNDKAILAELVTRLPPDAKASPVSSVHHLYSVTGFANGAPARVRRFNLGYWNLARFARTRTFAVLLDEFESHLQLTVAEYAPRRIFVHAGVVAWKEKAILIPGASFSGKSNLVAELLRAGATYYSDEYAVIDARGRVHPYARDLRIRSGQLGRVDRTRAAELGARTGTRPLPIAFVLSTTYRPGARFRPRELTRGKAVLELLRNTVSARSQPEMGLAYLTKAIEQATTLKGARGEASEMGEWILRSVD
jgi:hypothetical protein